METLVSIYIECLNRFPDDDGISTYLPILKKKSPEYIKKILLNSPEYKLPKKDIIFDNFINKNMTKLNNFSRVLPEVSDKCALICEGRKHKYIGFIIKEVLYHLDETWTLTIVCTNENKEYIQNETIGILNINYICIDKLDSFIDYNNLLLSIEFWKQIKYEKVLVFQCDSILCKKGIEKFLKYDFIGAPSPDFKIMNGGLSIRTVSKMIKCLELQKPNKYEEEDKFFTRILNENIESVISTFEIATIFSIEHVYNCSPYGIHKAWRFLEIKDILDNINFYDI